MARCPICKGENIDPIFIKRGIPYFRCRNCDFRFSMPDVNANLQNTLSDFENAYLTYFEPDPADKKNFDAIVQWIARFAPMRNIRLLDVGCGSGKFVRYLLQRDIPSMGIEPSTALFNHFLSNESSFFCGDIDKFSATSPEPFNVIVAFDVIEHAPDPVAFLRGIENLLAPGGAIFLSAPDAASLNARLLGRRWHFYNHYHLSYLSAANLCRIANELGLNLVHISHRGRWRSLGYLARYLFEFACGRKSPNWVQKLDRAYIPINLRDIMFVVLTKNSNP